MRSGWRVHPDSDGVTSAVDTFHCACAAGYENGGEQAACTDVNECGDPCGVGGVCTQTSDGVTSAVDTFHCACAAGYENGGEQAACTDVNECAAGNEALCGLGDLHPDLGWSHFGGGYVPLCVCGRLRKRW